MLVVFHCWFFLITLQAIASCLKERNDLANSEIKNPSPLKESSTSLASQSQSSQRPIVETNRSSKKIKKAPVTKPRTKASTRTEPSSHAEVSTPSSIDRNQEKTPMEPSPKSQWENTPQAEQVSAEVATAHAELPMDDGYENYGPGDGTVEKENSEYEWDDTAEVRTATIYSKEKHRGGSKDAPSRDERQKKKLKARKMKTVSQTKRLRKRPTKETKSNKRGKKMPAESTMKTQ